MAQGPHEKDQGPWFQRQVLDVLWSLEETSEREEADKAARNPLYRPRPARRPRVETSARMIHEALEQQELAHGTGKTRSVTTVRTVLERMTKHGLLARVQISGIRDYGYVPTLSRREYYIRVCNEFFTEVFDGDFVRMMSSLAAIAKQHPLAREIVDLIQKRYPNGRE